MNIAIVGPSHPYKGGIPQHTTELAHQLEAAGHQVTLVAWRNQYPSLLYPGEQFVPHNTPERPLFARTLRVLSWRNPLGWWLWGRRLRAYDRVIFIWWVPLIQGPVYWLMLRALGDHHRHTTLICHNVVQRESGKFDGRLTTLVFNTVGRVIVHSTPQADLAQALTTTPIITLTMAPHLPSEPTKRADHSELRHRLLFFGLVRHYKGVDILLRALAQVPDIQLTVAGEMWGKSEINLRGLITELHLEDRVDLRPGYVPADALEPLFANADALVLPYRSGTGTQNHDLAFAYGLPVIATRVGNLPQTLNDGTDSLLCTPGDDISLAAAIKHFYEPGVARHLQSHLPGDTSSAAWQAYVSELIIT